MRAYRIAYDGRPFRGFQRQPDVPTVEDALLDALRALDLLDEGTPPGYAAAGRTDAGVSARAQTVAFDAPEWLTPAALNSELPAAVRAWASADAPSDFHATHDARSRTYTYHLYAPHRRPDGATSTGGHPSPEMDTSPDPEADEAPDGDSDLVFDPSADPAPAFDDGRARAALEQLAGEHDFHNLTPDDHGTVRDLSVRAERDGPFFVIRLTAGGFARQLVRRIVGLVAGIARGDSRLSTVDRVLAPEPLDGPRGVSPAPPNGLVLRDVTYALAFSVDEAAVSSAREVFADLRAERATGARVAGAVCDTLE